MRILMELVHPANVHYFKNFIFEMQKQGVEFLVIARDKDVTIDLLKHYGIPYINRGKGGNSFMGKLWDIPVAETIILKHALNFKPDIMMSFASMYVAHVATLLGKPHITFDDTEHNSLNHKMYVPFTKMILTPKTFKKDLGKNHYRINSLMEFGSIHPKYFKPNDAVFDYLGIEKGERFVLLRFISWNAIHDKGQTGFSAEIKMKAVEKFSKKAKVFISSEAELPESLEKYKIRIPSYYMHDALYYADLFFGESGTMAVEAALLGTPSVRVSTLAKALGNFVELRDKYDLLYYYDEPEEGFKKALEVFNDPDSKQDWDIKSKKYFEDKLDLNCFTEWLVMNYPDNLSQLSKEKTINTIPQ
jgi:predicted glycosyltransferase